MRQTAMNLDLYDAIVFISRNAVIYGLPHLQTYWPQWPQRLRWYAVGSPTAQQLKQFDIDATFPQQAGGQALFEVVDSSTGWQDIKRVLIVRGEGGLPILGGALGQRGIQVEYLEVYRRSPQYWPTLSQELHQVGLVVISAGEAVDTLCRSLSEHEIAALNVIVPSARVADIAKARGIRSIIVANDQNDDTLLSAVKDALNRGR
jgi:uroporphyrinogen-III synthase